MEKKDLKKYKIPDRSGVYFFLTGKKTLYIGKATSLKSRVASYFTEDLIFKRGPLVSEMLAKANNIKWQETENVLEALVLEAHLIKKNQPKYNTEGKSDKSFNYVCITKEEIPKVLLVRERKLAFEKDLYKYYFGPFTNGAQLKEGMKIVRRIFPYFDAVSQKKSNYSFYKQIALAPDTEKENWQEMYQKNIQNIKLFFEGKKQTILKDLEKEMKRFAKEKKFELAGEVKRQIFALKHINDVALLKTDNLYINNNNDIFRIEAYDIAHMSGKNMVGVMTVLENGQAVKSEYRKFIIRTKVQADDTGALSEVLERRTGHPEWRFPDVWVMDGGVAQLNVAKNILGQKGIRGAIVSVIKDERHKPKSIGGDANIARKYQREILMANSEAHRYAINFHKDLRNKNFLKK
ncbi:MAG: GIY-YIG nuclease family protein [Candidatus Pacebacteria bacterium]|nr:GIY-YIG nuclease family protein [Candidatus Paceibacterota bacterium]MCF7862429.1 GIY-YIG nuclease family protein [Candidatus Paceibacterota bacterium]